MAESNSWRSHRESDGNRSIPNGDDARNVRETGVQTDAKVQGQGPRLSKANLFTLLSLWMELFPKREACQQENDAAGVSGLVVVHECRVLGLHCSSAQLHAGQVAVVKHGPRLKSCELYFSRKPCSTCLKMLINAGVSRISYWPGDAELSLLSESLHHGSSSALQEAVLDATAAERLKSNSRPHISVLLQPLDCTVLQFLDETSQNADFLGKIVADNPALDTGDIYRREFWNNSDNFLEKFFISDEERHKYVLNKMGLENFCMEPNFSNLRQHMRNLIRILASVASSVPALLEDYGFFMREPVGMGSPGLPQDVIRHCVIQARLLACRTEDPKVGVGAVIWAEGKQSQCDGTGQLYLVGCGYNAYPVGSQYAEYPQMDHKQEERQNRKYRYILHAEQNALTFRSAEIKAEDNTMMFVTKCPCDECVPLIGCAGIKQIYTTDLDSNKVKHDISYLRFNKLNGVQKFIWQQRSSIRNTSEQDALPTANGCFKRKDEESSFKCNKRPRS
ncbi:cytidine and dCMP deaminase domain-containing protein 1 isoform X2 [Danio rerio]|uniref:Cytidine and dCMP deaminase domain-containing protein 1 n=1 Tax=Danio rerio TaxID=7955 RepID=F8W4G5_DANRE|nr:cytidine and dCMP deaminase domain-containing protein 1 isoform X2 [Danio rerio]|eukprot:XP_005171045.1 cytidine and dCMP deaminase domain-containing protein 1 isoform X2 [Danio rerio]